MAERDVNIKIGVDTGDAQKSLGQLESEFEQLNEAIREVPRGSAEFKKLQKQLTATGREIKNVELAFESLDNEQVASEIGSVAGAVGDVTAAYILLGDGSEESNKELEKTAKKIETALGVSMAFKGAIEGVSSARKLLNNSTMVSNTLERINNFIKGESAVASAAAATGEGARATATAGATAATSASTVALKLFRMALVATGIGAIVVGLGMLIIHFDKVTAAVKAAGEWVQGMYYKFQNLGMGVKIALSLLFPFVGIIWAAAEALEYFGVIESEEEYKARKLAEEQAKLAKEKAKAIKAETKAKIEAFDEEIEALQKLTKKIEESVDWEIEKRKAAGEDVAELEEKKINNLIESYNKELELIDLKIQAKEEEFKKLDELNNKAVAWDKISAKIDTVGYKNQKKKKEKQLEEQNQQLELFHIQQDKIAKDAWKKSQEEKKKQHEKELEDEKKRQEELLKAQLDAIAKEEEVTEAYRKRQLTNEQKEIDDLTDRLYKELEMAGENNELKLLLEEEYQANVEAIKQKYVDEWNAKQKEQEDKQKEQDEKDKKKKEDDEKKEREDRIKAAEETFNSLKNLNNAVLEAELAAAGDNEQKKQEIRKKAFKRQKALDLADATIQGIKAVQAALASPFPFNIALAAINGATAAANIAKISAVQFDGESGGSASGDFGNTARATGGANIGQVQNTTTVIGEPTKVYVTEQDISDTQGRVRVAESQASL